MAAIFTWARNTQAHGGAEAAASLVDPAEPGIIADESYTFTWLDFGQDGEGGPTIQKFYYSPYRPPPWYLWGAPENLDRRLIADGIRETDPTNALTWNTSTVAAGAYWIWSEADDPDILNLATTIRFSPYPLVIAHNQEPLSPWVKLTAPATSFDWADESFEVKWERFDPDESATISLSARLSETSTGVPLLSIAENIPASEGSYQWDTSALPEGDYVIFAALEDARGMSFETYAEFFLIVVHSPAQPDAGQPASMDAGVLDVGADNDAGVVSEPSDKGGCSCVLPREATRAPFVWCWSLFFSFLFLGCKKRLKQQETE